MADIYTDAYRSGKEAARNYKPGPSPASLCPYPLGTAEANQWFLGFAAERARIKGA